MSRELRSPGVGRVLEVLVVACCGWDVERTMVELPLLRARPGWETLPAVRAGAVFVVDGTTYMSRPGPGLVDSLELLETILRTDDAPLSASGARRVGS